MTDMRPPAIFIADALALDFLNSIGVPVDKKVEWLASGEDLLGWLEQADLVPDDVMSAFRKTSLPGELDAVAAQARALREWFRAFVYKHKGKPLKPNALHQLDPLNQMLARDEEFALIAARDPHHDQGRHHEHGNGPASSFVWRQQRRWRSPDSLLLPIVRSMADSICTDDFTYVKECEWPTCTYLFVDRTRGYARRWCSMATCGNRAKQAAHRQRAQQARK